MEKPAQPVKTKGSDSAQARIPPDTSSHYVNRRAEELLKRYSGTRERRQRIAEQMYEASQYQLMLAKFKKHRVAVVSFYLLVVLYSRGGFC